MQYYIDSKLNAMQENPTNRFDRLAEKVISEETHSQQSATKEL